MDILITAGATRNPIDAMRYISANSSGQTGVWIAEQLYRHHAVHLMGSPEALLRCRIDCFRIGFGSTHDLMQKMRQWTESHADGMVIHAAAVGDYCVDNPPVGAKLPSGQGTVSLQLVPTPKIVDQIHTWAPRASLISFKAAAPNTERAELERLASAQRERTGSLLVFANVIGNLHQQNLIVGPKGSEWFDSRPLAMASLVSSILEHR